MQRRLFAPLVLVLLLTGCNAQSRAGDAAVLPASVGARAASAAWADIPAPKDNPVTQAKVELGFRLWFEPKLSGNNRMTCGTCHNFNQGFSNGEATAAGITGERGNRNTPTIYALAGSHAQFWDGRAASLEEQALGPIENPIEMNAKLPDVIRKLEATPYYPQKFKEAFGTRVTADGIAKAIASFERALHVKASPYERFWAGDKSALTLQQQQGMAIFNSPRGRCVACHSGADLTDRNFWNVGVGMQAPYRPDRDLGRYGITKRDEDYGKFKTPTLRNIALSAPYMHDGSLATLEDVVAFYNRGGNENANLDPRIRPLGLSVEEQASLVAFLKALTAPDNFKELAKLPGIHNAKESPAALGMPAELFR